MSEKVLAVKAHGEMFYGAVNNNGDILKEEINFSNEEFENAILLYLSHCFRTNDFKKPYDIKLPQYQKEFRITVEVINKDDIDG